MTHETQTLVPVPIEADQEELYAMLLGALEFVNKACEWEEAWTPRRRILANQILRAVGRESCSDDELSYMMCAVQVLDHDPATMSFRARVTLSGQWPPSFDEGPKATAVLSFPAYDLVWETPLDHWSPELESLLPAFQDDRALLTSWTQAIVERCCFTFEHDYPGLDLDDFAVLDPRRAAYLKESRERSGSPCGRPDPSIVWMDTGSGPWPC